jgi:molybdopterin synthase catalytic subunit
MNRQLTITTEPIDEPALLAQRESSAEMGAIIYFLGVVRQTEGASTIAGIDYEAFEKMAARQFSIILDAIEEKWPIASIRLVHRIGFVPAGEPSLWIEIISPHRPEAFAACQFLIDQMKQFVPIWKHPRRS